MHAIEQVLQPAQGFEAEPLGDIQAEEPGCEAGEAQEGRVRVSREGFVVRALPGAGDLQGGDRAGDVLAALHAGEPVLRSGFDGTIGGGMKKINKQKAGEWLYRLGWLVIILVFGFVAGLCFLLALGRPPLICKITDWQHPDGKIVRCLRVGAELRGGGATEVEPTETELVYPTATEWEPWSTATLTPTPGSPIPATETAYPGPEETVGPYPGPEAWLYWWSMQ